MAGPSLGYLIVNLPMAIAMMLHTIMTIATVGLQVSVLGTAASREI